MQVERAPMLGIALAVLLLVVEGLGLVALRDARLERGDDNRVGDRALEPVRRAEVSGHGVKLTRCGMRFQPDGRLREIIREREEEFRALVESK